MLQARLMMTALLCGSLAVPAVAMTHARRGPTSHAKTAHKHTKKKKAVRGQRAIDDARATEIQQALIKSGYLTGEPSGHWDAQSEAAMQKLQADNGWQTKLIPDSRALIKLGLGPKPVSAPSTVPVSAQPAPASTAPATDQLNTASASPSPQAP